MEKISISEEVLLPVVCEADVVIAGAGPGGLGAALAAAVVVAQRAENAGKTLVCILPDRGDGSILA